MAITLEKLFESAGGKYNLKLIAGKNGMKNIIRWVHMIEDIEVPNFIHGNELIFTTGIGRLDTADKILEFVMGLRNNNAVGLVVNLGPYIKKVPNIVVDYCEKNDFPLFTLPWEVKIIDITYDFCRIIIENEKSEISVVEAFRHIMITGEYRDEYEEIFKKMSFQTKSGYRVMIIDFTYKDRSVTENFSNNNYVYLWKNLAKSSFASAMFMIDGRIAVVRQNVGGDQLKRAVETLAANISPLGISLTAGISDEETGTRSVYGLYREAEAALFTARENNETAAVYRDIGINQLIFAVKNKKVLKKFADSRLGAVEKYDAENKTDYLSVLKLYLECGSSVKLTSEKIGVHRNTINYKIKQIKEILGGEPSAEGRTELILAFRIRDLLKYL